MINKIWRLLARLIKKERNGMQIDKIQSEKEKVIITQRLKLNKSRQLYPNQFKIHHEIMYTYLKT